MPRSWLPAYQITKNQIALFIVLFLTLLIGTIPFNYELGIYGILFDPDFFSIILFHCLVYRPDLVKVRHLFILGLINDALFGFTLGVSSLYFLLLMAFMLFYRRILLTLEFGMIWLNFFGFMVVNTLIEWFLLYFIDGIYLNWLYCLPSIVITCVLYPFAVRLLAKGEKLLEST